MSIITTVKDKILKNCILARILPPARIQGQKVVLARKIEKQGLGSTPGLKMLKYCSIQYCTFTVRLWNEHARCPCTAVSQLYDGLGRVWRGQWEEATASCLSL